MADGTRELRLVITASDYDAALHCYRDVLGLREEAAFADPNGGRATVLHAGRATLELADASHAAAVDELEVGRRVAGPVRIALEVGDAAGTTDRLVEAAELVAAPVRTPRRSLNARVAGPDGQQLTIYSNEVHLVEHPASTGPSCSPNPTRRGPAPRSASSTASGPRSGTACSCSSTSGRRPCPGCPRSRSSTSSSASPTRPTRRRTSRRSGRPATSWWSASRHEHRLLRHEEPAANLHVFAVGSSEVERMLAFRDHLRGDAADRELYLGSKRELAARTRAHLQDYADAKSDVVEDVLRRAL